MVVYVDRVNEWYLFILVLGIWISVILIITFPLRK